MDEYKTQQALSQLSRKMGGKAASALLSALGRDRQFINAIESTIGQELLADAVAAIEDKISLVLAEKDEPKDRAELQAYLSITRKWQAKIERYNQNKSVFEKGAN